MKPRRGAREREYHGSTPCPRGADDCPDLGPSYTVKNRWSTGMQVEVSFATWDAGRTVYIDFPSPSVSVNNPLNAEFEQFIPGAEGHTTAQFILGFEKPKPHRPAGHRRVWSPARAVRTAAASDLFVPVWAADGAGAAHRLPRAVARAAAAAAAAAAAIRTAAPAAAAAAAALPRGGGAELRPRRRRERRARAGRVHAARGVGAAEAVARRLRDRGALRRQRHQGVARERRAAAARARRRRRE